MDDSQASCGYCRRKDLNLRRCTRCLSIYYCSKGCQTMDWLSHKLTCLNKSQNGDKTTRRKTANEMLFETMPEEFNEPQKVKGKNSTDNYRHRSECDGIIGAKVKPEYSPPEKHTTYELRGNGKEPGNVSDQFYSHNDAKTKTEKEEFGFGNVKKDGTTSKNTSHFRQEKMSKSVTNLCGFCSFPGRFLKCSRCKETFYCSQECQRRDWTTHKISCTKKLSEEEEIKKRHEGIIEENKRHLSVIEKNYGVSFNIQNYQGPFERILEMLSLEQALYRATRPAGSLQRAVRLAETLFPIHDIVTEFHDIPCEPVFPFFPFMVPRTDRYILVAFMYRYHEHVMRHGVYLKDAHEKDSKVKFYFDHVGDNPFPFFSYSQVKPGGYICLVNPVMHLFADRSVGIRINNPDQVKVLDTCI